MTTTITTAARRIVRTVNAAPRSYDRFYFAADGTEVARLAGPEAFGPGNMDYAITGYRGITQAEAQVQLDAYAAALAANPQADRIAIDSAITRAVETVR